eukprot:15482370-Alexandrium_andersonii.AAC.1
MNPADQGRPGLSAQGRRGQGGPAPANCPVGHRCRDGTSGPALHYHAGGPLGYGGNTQERESARDHVDRRNQTGRYHAQAGPERLHLSH